MRKHKMRWWRELLKKRGTRNPVNKGQPPASMVFCCWFVVFAEAPPGIFESSRSRMFPLNRLQWPRRSELFFGQSGSLVRDVARLDIRSLFGPPPQFGA